MFGKLNITAFYPLYKEFYIWTNEVSVLNLHCVLQSIVVFGQQTEIGEGYGAQLY